MRQVLVLHLLSDILSVIQNVFGRKILHGRISLIYRTLYFFKIALIIPFPAVSATELIDV